VTAGTDLQRLVLPIAAAFLAGVAVAGALTLAPGVSSAEPADRLAALKAEFRRPASVPFPSSNPFSEAKRALGERLFHDRRLSADRSIACATCHIRPRGFADGRAQGRGLSGVALKRHTPTLWNLAWAGPVFWDGRARSLEEQVAGPIEAPDEMGQPVASVVALLSADPSYVTAFAGAFPDDPRITAAHLAAALATFERTLVSPRTRFDRWIDGDATALRRSEIEGFRLFTGKAQCTNCHSGWAFTDSAFHDIGLPGEDRGRGAVLRLPAAEYAFKTPGLREVARSAPYMHDGTIKTLDAVVRHYENGIVARPTLSADLPRKLKFSARERAALVAFLETLSSERTPQPLAPVIAEAARTAAPAAQVRTVTQSEKNFHPTHVALKAGERLWLLNNDTRTHNVRVFDPGLDFDSGAQEPGETVEIAFPEPGSYLVFCGIHPKMELTVDVDR
jgi:cytochrome c peroxidase